MANWLTAYKGPGGGIGIKPYEDALKAGKTPAQVAAALPGAGIPIGPLARARLEKDLQDLDNKIKSFPDLEKRAKAADQYKLDVARLQGEISGYKGQIAATATQISGYNKQVADLTKQYTDALAQTKTFEKEKDSWKTKATDWESQFRAKSAEYDTAKLEAAQYRNEAVDRQLAGLRGGSSSTGSSGSQGTANITSGAPAYQGGRNNMLVNIDRTVSATDSVLTKKGGVVQQMRGSSAPNAAPSRQLASGAPSGYYKSRFG